MSNRFRQGYALTVGIGEYEHLNHLATPPADAYDIAELLIAQCGYSQNQVRMLIDEYATKTALNNELDWLARCTTSSDTVIIFFSGHGVQRIGGFEPGEYLCPVEADWNHLRSTAISDLELTSALERIRAGRIAVLLDACHSGGVGQPKGAELQIEAGLSKRAYDRLAEGEGRVIVSSCRDDQKSLEISNMRNGLFSHYLLEGLRGKAAKDDGAVRVAALFEYIEREVRSHAERIGVTQTPWLKASTENFVVAVTADSKASVIPQEDSDDAKEEPCAITKERISWFDFANKLLDILMTVPALQHYDNRSHLIRGLPRGPAGYVRRSYAVATDLRNIVTSTEGWGMLDSGKHALVVVAENAEDFVSGLEQEEAIEALLAEWKNA